MYPSQFELALPAWRLGSHGTRSARVAVLVPILSFCVAVPGAWADNTSPAVTATLNGLEITLDRQTGSILRLKHAGPGVILETTAGAATLIDLAYPIPQFEPLRLASRFSTGARISEAADQVTVRWDKLGPSRALPQVSGRVSATVTLKAAPGGKSVIFACQVENQSDTAVRQVLFPDLLGLLPFAGPTQTEFCTGVQTVKPFVSLARSSGDSFYAVNHTFAEFKSSGKDSGMPGRWLDLGGPKSGFGLFPARTAWDTGPIVFLQMWEQIDKLRLMCNHYVDLGKGATWKSPEYWLTPYCQARSEATDTYQNWLKKQEVGHER